MASSLPVLQPAASRHFVFVHGACLGGWCWYKMKTLLEGAGHKVTCIDLAGAGINLCDPNKIPFFAEYNQPLSDFFASLPDNEKACPNDQPLFYNILLLYWWDNTLIKLYLPIILNLLR